MSIIRRALLIVPASIAALALSGAVAQADTSLTNGDDNSVSSTTTNNQGTWIDDSFNEINTVDVDIDWDETNHHHHHGHGHDGAGDNGDDD
ncbi:hypothetical protein AB0I60_00645 [Actinosynnema sp. NPDC050436]|uniref:hypothetical protein n=1 Tax=Actinosynnema sp. NPDC050436 TaxID=3155659 RepID=UPI0033ED6F26